MLEPKVFQPEQDDQGIGHGFLSDGTSLSVLPDGNQKIFFRCGIKKHLQSGETEHIRWLVGELNGVRCYVQGDNVILTTQDLYP